MISELITKKNISVYRLAKNCGIPYTTVNDICSGRARLEKCSAETVYKISKELGVSMEELIEPYLIRRIDFELFKSNVCHKVKEIGDIAFIIETLENNDIRTYFNRKWYRESLYLLAMLDYLSRLNNVPLCADYDDIRRCKLKEIVYPSSVIVACAAAKSDYAKQQALKDAIPEFLRFNIVEGEVRNVV